MFLETSYNYWRVDGYNWTNLRSLSYPKANPRFRRISFQLIAGKEKVDFYRHEWYPAGQLRNYWFSHKRIIQATLGLLNCWFVKIWNLFTESKVAPPNHWKTPFVLVHYTGSYNLDHYKALPHGNRRPTPEKNAARLLRELTGEATPEKPVSPEAGKIFC